MAIKTDSNPLRSALLALASGEVFAGKSFGHPGPATGEIVFNTSLTGYQEIISDPSYQGQLVCMTAPHIGVVGVNEYDNESEQPKVAALIIRDLSPTTSNWRAQKSLAEFFLEHSLTGICEVDTRRLTCILRDQGAVNGCIVASEDHEQAIALARDCPAMAGNPLGKTAGRDRKYLRLEGIWQPIGDGYETSNVQEPKIAILDCGTKQAIIRELNARQCHVEVLPYSSNVEQIAANFSGLVISNGPGDPAPLTKAIDLVREIIQHELPLLGICLGHQVIGIACGARSVKMKFGHHGANHPVLDKTSGQVFITSQNHGFAITSKQLPDSLEITHVSLFDDSIQGLRHKSKPVLSFQGHPEASPGPHEMTMIFDRFTKLVHSYAASH